MPYKSNGKPLNVKDVFVICALILYFGCLLSFSSLFYLATEDYEAVAAVDFVTQGRLLGEPTGWPYTPLAGYLFYLHSIAFGESLLGFRLLTGLLLLSSVVPVYLTLRTLADASMASALTLLSYSLSTFPHPRLEYFVEGAVASFAIYLGVKYVQTNRRIYVYGCAVFAFLAFASRGHPNSSALLLLLPIGLISARLIVASHESWKAALARLADQGLLRLIQIRSNVYGFICIGVLTIASLVWISRFLREILYRRLFVEYADLNDLSSTWIKSNSTFWSWILLVLVASIYLAIRQRGTIKASMVLALRKSMFAFVPFIVVGGLVLVSALWVGYSLKDLLFFIFPIDIIADHQAVGRIGSRAKGVLPVFLIVTAATLYFYLNDRLRADRAAVSLFLLLLVPATFARFFPTYNMLYLGVFPVAVFFSCVLPCVLSDNQAFYSRIKGTMVVFFIIYSLTSNYLLFVKTQVGDLNDGRLIKLQSGALSGILVESDVFRLFEEVRARLDLDGAASNETIGFLSSRYVKFIPMVYGWEDSLAGQNLMIQLGKLWSYDDLIKINGVDSDDVFNWAGLIYRWRKAAADRIEKSGTNVLVMSLYEKQTLDYELTPSSDPFREYLRRNFRIVDFIEPTMRLYRRSSLPEGAVILQRKAQPAESPED